MARLSAHTRYARRSKKEAERIFEGMAAYPRTGIVRLLSIGMTRVRSRATHTLEAMASRMAG